uniref:Uncharacterized protein n=1 Tax=Populus trichocarpa TaxID=3694 RepID=A9P9P8_POPTR|nr:unknown [Populus trichocarpa]ABK93862.1 unknown [Populus trichocarpa]
MKFLFHLPCCSCFCFVKSKKNKDKEKKEVHDSSKGC